MWIFQVRAELWIMVKKSIVRHVTYVFVCCKNDLLAGRASLVTTQLLHVLMAYETPARNHCERPGFVKDSETMNPKGTNTSLMCNSKLSDAVREARSISSRLSK
jgi:hypothetical protein